MAEFEQTIVNLKDLEINARARHLYAKQMFQTADSSEAPNSQVLIDAHEAWLDKGLSDIGINGKDKNLYVTFRDVEVPNQKDKAAFRKIEREVRASANNILQGLLWYEAPEFASWGSPTLTVKADNIIVGQDEARDYMLARKRREGWRIADYNTNPMEHYKSLVVGYYPTEEVTVTPADFTLTANEHYPGVQGSFDYTDSKRKHIGVTSTFDPQKQLFTVNFGGYSDFIGWDQIEGEAPIYRLTYVRNMVRDIYSKVKSGVGGLVQLSRWRAY